MNELFDKLILRIVLTGFICIILLVYKYAHVALYPSSRQQLFKRFYPSKNSPDTLHLFSRLLGIGILFTEFRFFMAEGFWFALLDFFIQAIAACFLYLLSIYIQESIVLYNFEYQDEIPKRKNFAYALICATHAIGMAYILKTIISVADGSLVNLAFLWMLSMVLAGFATKTYSIMSKLSFNRLLVHKSMALAVSYLGFTWGWTILIAGSLRHELNDIKWYGIQVILKLILALIILPVFIKGIKLIFKLQDDLVLLESVKGKLEHDEVEFGYGVFEGAIYFTAAFLTTVITENIVFGDFYPIF